MESYELGSSWGNLILEKFTLQTEAYASAFTKRVFPAFDAIETEAEQFSNDLYKKIGQMPDDGSMDMADAAEYALEEGVEYYVSLWGVRQSMISIALAGLSHLLEQQILFFLRKELLDTQEEGNGSLITFKEFRRRLETCGIVLSDLEAWPHVEQLRLITNVVKHGEGWSAEELRAVRPDLFEDPRLNDFSFPVSRTAPIFMPLAGEDLYPTIRDFSAYTSAAISFWRDLLSEYYDN